ncbi:MAG: Pr6Pr family membrane protein [Bacteroidales bacterium]|nr:Pr6Pr family membrane protein [Candidatus Cryptobacteroides onthequi]
MAGFHGFNQCHGFLFLIKSYIYDTGNFTIFADDNQISPHEIPLRNSLLYFTIQSNFWIAAVCMAGGVMMLKGISPGRSWSVAKMMFTISITLTGTVFCFILAPTMEGNPFTLSSCLVHVFSPLLAVVDYLVVSRCLDLRYKDALWGAVPPLYYLGFASLGYILNWQFSPGVRYPYFFLDWGSPLGAFGFSRSFPFMGVVWYAVGLLGALVAVSLLYIAASRALRAGRDA